MEIFREDFVQEFNAQTINMNKLSYKFKLAFYALYGKLLTNYFNNRAFYVLLLLIETPLSVYYPFTRLNPDYDVLRHVAESNAPIYIFATVAILVFLYSIIFGILFGISYCVANAQTTGNKKVLASEWKEYFKCWFRFYGFLLTLFQTVLLLPVLWVCIAIFKENTANSFLLYVASGIIASFALGLAISTVQFFHDKDMRSELPWNMTPLVTQWMKLLQKVVLAIGLCVYDNRTLDIGVLVTVAVLGVVEIDGILQNPPLGKKLINFVLSVKEAGGFAFVLFVLIDKIFEEFVLDYFSYFLAIFPTAAILLLLSKHRQREEVFADPGNNIENYMRHLLMLYEEYGPSSATLIGVLQNHCSTCIKTECPCKDIEIYEKDYYCVDDGLRTVIQAEDGPAEAQSVKIAGASRFKYTFYYFLNYLLKESIGRSDAPCALHILSSQIQLRYLRNKFQALYELQEANEHNPGVYEEYNIYRIKYCLCV